MERVDCIEVILCERKWRPRVIAGRGNGGHEDEYLYFCDLTSTATLANGSRSIGSESSRVSDYSNLSKIM